MTSALRNQSSPARRPAPAGRRPAGAAPSAAAVPLDHGGRRRGDHRDDLLPDHLRGLQLAEERARASSPAACSPCSPSSTTTTTPEPGPGSPSRCSTRSSSRRCPSCIGVSAAALGAYAFSQLRFRGKDLLFLAYVALLLVPWTLTLIPLFLTIQKLHLFNTWWALVLPYAASAQPLLVLIFRGFFDQIPRELLESARVDGCRRTPGPGQDRAAADPAGPAHRRDPGHDQRLGRLPVAHHRHPGPAPAPPSPPASSSSSAASALNLSTGGRVFAAFVIATMPMFILVGFTMRYFVSGLTEGALKL